jgi:hypothetical protein
MIMGEIGILRRSINCTSYLAFFLFYCFDGFGPLGCSHSELILKLLPTQTYNKCRWISMPLVEF